MNRSLSIIILLAFFSCNLPKTKEQKPDSPKQIEKWLPYKLRLEKEEKAKRKLNRLQAISTYTRDKNTQTAYRSAYQRYDQEGNLTLEIAYNAEGNTIREVKNVYQEDRIVKSKVTATKAKSYSANYFYDEKGNLERETLFKPNGDTLLARFYKYDARGNEIEANMENPRRQLRLQKITEYDQEGRPIQVSERRGKTLNWTETYTYSGLNWSTKRSDGEGNVLGIFTSHFNAAGKAISIENRKENGDLQFAIHYSYDEAGNLDMEDHLGKTGDSQQKIRYNYDNKGFKIEMKISSSQFPEGKVSRYTLEMGK